MVVAAWGALARAAESDPWPLAHCDGTGRIRAILCDNDLLPLETEIRVPDRTWAHVGSQGFWSVNEIRFAETNGIRQWDGEIRVDDRQTCWFRQTIREEAGRVLLQARLQGGRDLSTAGAHLFTSIPVGLFAGGTCRIRRADGSREYIRLPVEPPESPHVFTGEVERVVMVDRGGRMMFEAVMEHPRAITLQDDRRWNVQMYSLFVRFGDLAGGEPADVGLAIRLTGAADHAPARLTVDAARERYVLDGFGGNFAYALDSPVAMYNLDHLRPRWARTQASLAAWEPENDNGDPASANWAGFEKRDAPGSALRREFEMLRTLSGRGARLIVSVWDLPEWMYEDPGKAGGVPGRRVGSGRWGEVLEGIGTYLQYAKRRYGAEPELFCFNESMEGIRVKLTPEEHRDAVKRLGALFAKLGLRTKVLLGDAGQMRGTHAYLDPSLADPEAMAAVGAISAHSWGGATPAEYAAWGRAARLAGRPLLIAEVGWDAWAFHAPWFIQSPYYAVQDMRLWQELLLYAEPQGLLYWEYSNDYALCRVARRGGSDQVVPGMRFWLIKQLVDSTPSGARALGSGSDHPRVLTTAFRIVASGRQPGYVVHIANLGAERTAELSGLPEGVATLRAVETAWGRNMQPREGIPVRAGAAVLELAPLSLLTLTAAPTDARDRGAAGSR